MGDARLRLSVGAEDALRVLARAYAANPATARKVTGEVCRFVCYAEAAGVRYVDELNPELVVKFLWTASKHHAKFSDVSATTASNRQSFLRRFFGVLADLGLWHGPDPVGASIRRNDSEPSRVLTAAELASVRTFAHAGPSTAHRALLVAFAEAGGDASEIAQLTLDDIDLGAATVKFDGPAVRFNSLTEWGTATVRAVLAQAAESPGSRLCVSDGIPLERAAHSVTVRLRDVLVDAGLAGRPRVTARSIRLTIARQVLDSRGIEAATRFLGNESLDATARMLDHRWQGQ